MNKMKRAGHSEYIRPACKGLTVFLIVILLVLFGTTTILAFVARSGNIVTISGKEIIEGDLYAAGGTVIMDGTINGDLIAAGRSILVNGKVNGSIIAAGETVNINGEITHSVRVAGNSLNISSMVGRDLLIAGREFRLASTSEVGGDLLFGAGTGHIEGLIKGDVKSGVQDLTVASTANIHGKLDYTSRNEAVIETGAQISGMITHKLPEARKGFGEGMRFWGSIITFFMSFVLGIILILLAPERMREIAAAIRNHPWISLGWGILILIVVPIFAMIVCITVIGLPVGLIAFAFYFIAIYVTQIFVGLLIGQWILGAFREIKTKATLIAALALGLIILRLLRFIPFVGFFVGLATVLLGLGAILVTERKRSSEA